MGASLPPSRRAARLVLGFGLLAGLLLGGAMTDAAWQHNPQGEFHDESGIRWGSLLVIGASWFLLVFVPCAVLALSMRNDTRE
jgi:hypothetical protein